MELRPEEARAARESGGAALETVDDDDEEDEADPPPGRSRVFRALWGRGAHLTSGGKFGGDFLVYPGPPSHFHAGAVALCPRLSLPQPLGALLAGARLGSSVRKALLLCAAPPGGALACTAIQWRADLA
ncbi:hypothetical protein HGM15179_020085 [Zosterops borbonicus]|uniref:tRNA-intron lyase n=1 Tax=Zosterops borbonicus TaxID=364589 RepID=A0A8K1D8P8_9PASS|nr:hypothetical protein HGM15179_020085 [Zosterops borbonicus]